MNITVKQYIGGFVGGFLGIVFLHFLGILGMLSGCCFGFIGGFWFQEIWQKVTAPSYTFKRVLSFLIADWEKTILHWSLFTEWSLKKIRFGNSITEQIIGTIGLFFSKLPGWIVRFVRFISRKPRQFIQWYKSSPINRLNLTTLIVTCSWAAVCFGGAWWLSSNYPLASEVHEVPSGEFHAFYPAGNNPLYWVSFIVIGFLGPLVSLIILLDDDKQDLPKKRLSRWKSNTINFGLVNLVQILYGSCLISLSIYIIIMAVIPVFVILTSLVLSAMLIEAGITVLLQFARLSTRKASLIGGLTTLVVTIITALVVGDNLNNTTVWLVAFLNGNLCGGSIIGSHYLSRSAFIRYKKLIKVAHAECDAAFWFILGIFGKGCSRFFKFASPILSKPLYA